MKFIQKFLISTLAITIGFITTGFLGGHKNAVDEFILNTANADVPYVGVVDISFIGGGSCDGGGGGGCGGCGCEASYGEGTSCGPEAG